MEIYNWNYIINYITREKRTDLLSESERVAEGRKELNNMIKVMKNVQKILRSDPDLMTVM